LLHSNIIKIYTIRTHCQQLRCKLLSVTSCVRGDTICLRPLQVDNIFVFIRQVAPVPACWLFKTSHQQQVDLWPFDLESGVRVTCDVGYLYANFGLPRPLCSRVRPDVRDRQTDVRQKHRLMPPAYVGGGIIMRRRFKNSVGPCDLELSVRGFSYVREGNRSIYDLPFWSYRPEGNAQTDRRTDISIRSP